MLVTKTITFEDLEGNEVTKDFYFRLNKAEVIEWLMGSQEYSLDKVLKKVAETSDTKKILELYKDIIHRSYGEKSANGINFIKNEEVWNNFYQSDAYSVLFMEFAQDAGKFAEFINDIIPKDLSEEIDKFMKENKDSLPAEIVDFVPNAQNKGNE